MCQKTLRIGPLYRRTKHMLMPHVKSLINCQPPCSPLSLPARFSLPRKPFRRTSHVFSPHFQRLMLFLFLHGYLPLYPCLTRLGQRRTEPLMQRPGLCLRSLHVAKRPSTGDANHNSKLWRQLLKSADVRWRTGGGIISLHGGQSPDVSAHRVACAHGNCLAFGRKPGQLPPPKPDREVLGTMLKTDICTLHCTPA